MNSCHYRRRERSGQIVGRRGERVIVERRVRLGGRGQLRRRTKSRIAGIVIRGEGDRTVGRAANRRIEGRQSAVSRKIGSRQFDGEVATSAAGRVDRVEIQQRRERQRGRRLPGNHINRPVTDYPAVSDRADGRLVICGRVWCRGREILVRDLHGVALSIIDFQNHRGE